MMYMVCIEHVYFAKKCGNKRKISLILLDIYTH